MTVIKPQNAAPPGAANTDAARLCALYDGLLQAGGTVSPEAERELRALAKIFDLDAERPAAELWPYVRAVLVRQAPAPERTSTPAAEAAPLTVLLVEDDADAALDLTEALDAAGHRVVGPFHSAEAAAAATALHPIDVALLDINLSGENTGVDLARSLKSRWGVPVIFLSGDVTAAAQNAELAAAMVIKPYRGRDVLDALSRLESA
ncbi:Probable transcriptional regulatory protein pdtaR [Brevundimonas diminuta]|uniref:response regulator n=2 Tax=Brevundimonas diminuta TaxID=293 RepID=UPI000B4E41D1|nr:response regulator [Brevundimonas diminuta]OWR16372.1 response regulator [Brevundimonas diminuta]WQE44841.1 response regulator [Brevundimonas diminuta]SPU45503.1 Probable transcriptional regulatory protein pdtaR [Brevundimonas diminuta]SUW17356.1 Probable transcriptional regulatory protein pdtaR [Brevundimonas diminuta]